MGEFNDELERDKLTEAELSIVDTTRKENIRIFFINDKFYVFDETSNRKIMGCNADIGFNYLTGKMQSGSTAGRRVMSPMDKKRVKEAMHTFVDRFVNFTYNPSDKKIIEEGNLKYYNVFQPSFYADKRLEPPYTFPIIEDFLNHFFDSPDEKRWFIERLAYTLQNPEDRLPTTLLLTGMQGSGKDTLKTIIERTLGHQNLFNLDQQAIESNFNSYIGKSQVIFANELHSWKDPTRILNILKNLCTNKKISVNEKFMQPYSANNYAFWILATNDHRFRPADENDRRYSAFFQDKKLINNLTKDSYDKLMDLILSPEHENETYSEFHYFYWYLHTLDIPDKDFIRNPLQNVYREQMIKANLGNNVDYGIISHIIKELMKQDSEQHNRMGYDIKIMPHAGKYYIKPKSLIDGIVFEKQALNLYKEKKYKMQYDNVKQDLRGSLWFKDYTDSPVKIEGKSLRVFQIVEKRLIDIIEKKSTEDMDGKDGDDVNDQ